MRPALLLIQPWDLTRPVHYYADLAYQHNLIAAKAFRAAAAEFSTRLRRTLKISIPTPTYAQKPRWVVAALTPAVRGGQGGTKASKLNRKALSIFGHAAARLLALMPLPSHGGRSNRALYENDPRFRWLKWDPATRLGLA